MTIEGNDDIRYLIQTSQLPALQREVIESYGPFGVQFNQMGKYKNAQDISISFKEVITGKVLEFLRDWLKNKKYYMVKLSLVSESQTSSITHTSVILEDCWIEIDASDLSVEDGSSLIRPAGTLHANWITWLDDDQSVNLTM